MAKSANKPVHEVRLGRIKAAIWEVSACSPFAAALYTSV